MTARLVLGLAASLAPLLATSLAHAQAPGDPDEQSSVYAPPLAPPPPPAFIPPPPPGAPDCPPCPGCVVVQPGALAPARESVMARRWSVGLSIGSMGLAANEADTGTGFTVGELALRFRLTRHLELEGMIGGGRESTGEPMDSDLEVTTAALAARWRFNPEGRWNLFAMAGLGGGSVVRHDISDDERNAAFHPLGMVGIGIERRFRHFALQAEARAVAIGERDDDPEATARVDVVTEMPVTTQSNTASLGGGSLTLGLSYYF